MEYVIRVDKSGGAVVDEGSRVGGCFACYQFSSGKRWLMASCHQPGPELPTKRSSKMLELFFVVATFGPQPAKKHEDGSKRRM